MKINVETRSGKSLGSVDLDTSATLESLQQAFHSLHPRYPPERQRFYRAIRMGGKPEVLRSGSLASAGVSSGSVVLFKDLGPQVSWKLVFLIEYLGPLLIYPLFYSQATAIYGSSHPPQSSWAKEVQFSALIAWLFHFVKRELETVFVHRFSKATMPRARLFTNTVYYWGAAALIAYFVNHPLYTPPGEDLVYSGMCLFYFMEIGNLSCHWTLRNLRPPGTKIRRIPNGGLFEYVSCPNYTYEIAAWVGFNMMTKTVAGVVFMCFGAIQMLIWARTKHKNYKKEFNGHDGKELYPPRRKCLVPFIY